MIEIKQILGAMANGLLESLGFPAGPVGPDRPDRRPSYEELILVAVRSENGASFAAVIDQVVSRVIREEQQRGAWVSDISLWGPSLIRDEVIQTVYHMLGRTLVIEGDLDGPWIIAPARAA